MTETEYLTFANAQAQKYEFRGRRVYAMTGRSFRHAAITANAITHLSVGLRDADCTVTSPDMRVHIASKNAYRYPDVSVVCGDPVYLEGRIDTITNPVLLVEVLSPGTALQDRNEKLEEYTAIETVQAYVLLSQEKPKVEVFRRHEAGTWLYEAGSGMDARLDISIADVPLHLALNELYRKINFDDANKQED